MQFYIEPEKLNKAIYGQERPGHKYTSRRPKAGGGYEYEYADVASHEHAAGPKDPEWRIHKIHDLRDVDWETGKRIPLAAGAGATCDRCGKEHAVVYHMEHKPTGKQVCVGSGCGPGMAGGTHNLDDASVKQAEKEAKSKVLSEAREKLDAWTHDVMTMARVTKWPKPEFWLEDRVMHRYHLPEDHPHQNEPYKIARYGYKNGPAFDAHSAERHTWLRQGVVRDYLKSKIKERIAFNKIPEKWPFPKDLKTPAETVERDALEEMLPDAMKDFDRLYPEWAIENQMPKEMEPHKKAPDPWEYREKSEIKKSFDADDLYVAQDDFDLCMSWAGRLMEDGDFDRAMDLIKGAMHKYLRRYPSGKASPRWYYVYKVTSKHQGAPVQMGEKIKLTHEGQAGHYEVKNVHANGYVTMQHDETGHQLSVKQEHLHEMFSEEHKGAIDTAHARLRQTFDAAKKYGSDAQKQRARDALRQHEERYQIKTPERMAGKKALQLSVLTHGEPSVENHTAAATAHREAAKLGAPNAELHEQLAEQHEIAAKSWMARKASAEALKDPEPRFHVPANDDTVVDAPVLVLPKKENRGGKRPAKGAYFATKENAYRALKSASESNGTFLDNFAAADAAYYAWKKATESQAEARKGAKKKGSVIPKGRGPSIPRPPPMEGGDLDHLNQALSLEKPKRVLGKQPKDPRLTSPAEAWDRMVSGAKRWDAATARHAIQTFQAWFQDHGVPMHLPNEAHEAITTHYQAQTDADFAAGTGGEHEQAQIHELTQQAAEADASFDPDEIEGKLDDSFDFGFNATPETEQPLAMSKDGKQSVSNDEYLPLAWAQKLISATPGYAGATGVGEGIDPYLAAALKRTMTPRGVHAGKFFQEARNPSGPALDPRGEPLDGQASLEVLDDFLAKLPKGLKVEAQMDKSLQPHIFVVLPSKLHFLDLLEKAGGPYIGPKGGMWADPQHTQHWDPTKHAEPVPSNEIEDKVTELTQLSHDELANIKRQQDEYLAKLHAAGDMVPIAAMRLGRIIDRAIEKKGPRLVATVPAQPKAPPVTPPQLKAKPPTPAQSDLFATPATPKTEMAASPAPEPKLQPIKAVIPEKAKPTVQGVDGKLEAVGDHIWGSRKDLAQMGRITSPDQLSNMSFDDAVHIIRKKNLIPALDMKQLKETGMSPGTAHMTLALLAAIKEKPAENTAAQKKYVEDVSRVLKATLNCKKLDDFRVMIREFEHEGRGVGKWERVDASKPGEDLDATLARLQKEDPNAGYRLGRTWSERSILKPALKPFSELGTTFQAFLKQKGKAYDACYSDALTADNDWGYSKSAKIEDGWAFLQSRGEVNDAAKQAEIAKRRATVERAKARGLITTGEAESTPEEVQRKGGKTLTTSDAQEIKNTLGLREIDFGQEGYMTQKDRQYHLQRMNEAMHDFADVMGVDPKVLSFNGRLGIALGARGRGKAAAHYEPGRHVINLTKFSGGGSLAHEWGHAMDNIFAEMFFGTKAGSGVSYLTHAPESPKLPEEVGRAMANLHKAITKHPDPLAARNAHNAKVNDLREKRNRLVTENNELVGELGALKLKPEHEQARIEQAAKYKMRTETAAQKLAEAAVKLKEHEAKKKPTGRRASFAPSLAHQEHMQWKYAHERHQKKHAQLSDPSYVQTEADKVRIAELASRVEGDLRYDINRTEAELARLRRVDPESSEFYSYSAGDKYWGSKHELFARAFSTFAEDTLKDHGRTNTYLTWDKHEAGRYPQGKERSAINAAIHNLFDALVKGGHFEKALRFLESRPLQRFEIRSDMTA